MLPLKNKIGTRSGSHTEVVTAERIKAFCQAVGVSQYDEAPPTFLTVFRRGEFEMLQTLGLELANALHADQQYDIIQPIRAGNQIRFETEVSQVLEKVSTKQNMQFLTLETQFHLIAQNPADAPKLIGKSISTLVFREILEQK